MFANFKQIDIISSVGVWCTAWARWELETGLRLVFESGTGKFIYTDTDSIKYTGNVDFTEYNNERIKNSTKHNAYAIDSKGNHHYMGVFEPEGTCRRFVTLGAKKYAYVEKEGEGVHCTIAGVNKAKGGKELDDHGGLTAFEEGFVFRDAGSTQAIYNDDPQIGEYEIEGHKITITANIAILPSEYTLGITGEYERILKYSKYYLYF